jgi:hypothetical protein
MREIRRKIRTRPKGKPTEPMISFTVDHATHKLIHDLADQDRSSAAAIARRALRKELISMGLISA